MLSPAVENLVAQLTKDWGAKPAPPIADLDLAIKRAERPWAEVNAWRLQLHKEFEQTFASSKLPDRPDYTWANEFLIRARCQQIP